MLISNPLVSELFGPTALRLGAVMGGALVGLTLVVRLRFWRLGQNVLFQRWRTWAVIAPVYLFAILSGSITTLILVTFLVFQGLREYAGLVGLPGAYRWVLLTMGIIT